MANAIIACRRWGSELTVIFFSLIAGCTIAECAGPRAGGPAFDVELGVPRPSGYEGQGFDFSEIDFHPIRFSPPLRIHAA